MLRRDASAGVDHVTYRDYEEQAEQKIQELHERLKSKTYRAQPLRRIYIPKEDGRQRPNQKSVHTESQRQTQAPSRITSCKRQWSSCSTPSMRRIQFYRGVRRVWKTWLGRRSRGKNLTWAVYQQLLRRHPLLRPRITQPWAGDVRAAAMAWGTGACPQEGDLSTRSRRVAPEEPTAVILHGGVCEGGGSTAPRCCSTLPYSAKPRRLACAAGVTRTNNWRYRKCGRV
jgi:hypothetical protein